MPLGKEVSRPLGSSFVPSEVGLRKGRWEVAAVGSGVSLEAAEHDSVNVSTLMDTIGLCT